MRSRHDFACPIFVFVYRSTLFYCTRALLLSARARRRRISLKTRSACDCAVETRFRPPHLKLFFDIFPNMYWFAVPRLCFSAPKPPFSAGNAIRSCLCSPNTSSSFPILHFFRASALSYCARAMLSCAQELLRRISPERKSAYACAVQPHSCPFFCGVF